MVRPAGVAQEVIGREAELPRIRRFIEASLNGPIGLVLEGEPGIGKTTLWKWACSEAAQRSHRVLASRPAESEASLSFAGLSDLLGAVLEEVLPALPPPQARALEVALLRTDPDHVGPDQRAVSTAALEAVRALSLRSPVILAVDDVPWLDLPSARVLQFVTRRLTEEAVGVLLAQRVEPEPRRGPELERDIGESRMERLRVGPLTVAALHHVIQSRLEVMLPRSTLIRIHEISAGNPFFALELARALSESGSDFVRELLPIPESLRRLVHSRLRRLPARTREVLLAASALSSPTVPMIVRALGVENVSSSIDKAVSGGVLEVDRDVIRFSHPLLASVVYSEATAAKRRSVHRRLAQVTTDLEERARHLALGAQGSDGAVASVLEDAARLAKSRGAADAAAELFELASQLTPRADNRGAQRRSVEAATCLELVGDIQRARERLEAIVRDSPSGSDRARALIVLARATDRSAEAAEMLRQAQDEAESDPHLAASIRVSRAWNALYGRVDPVAADPLVRAAMAAAEELDDEWLLSRVLCVAGVVDFLLGRAHAVELLQRAVQLEGDTVPMGVVRLPSYFLANVLRWMDDFDSARRRLEALRLLAFELGTDASVYDVLFELSELECWAGRYGLALDYVDEMQDAAEMVGWAGSWAASARALVEAHLGRADTSRVAAERSLALATSQGDARVEAKTLAVLGFLELSLGDASAARRHLDRVAELTQRIEEPGVFRVAADHVESLVAVGDLREAKARLERFEEQSMSRARPWAEVTSARCRGLLLAASGQPEEALPSLDRAIEAHVALPMPLELGRTLLVQGEVLRRIRRKAAAKDSLERSLAIFEELGAKLWADRARAALRRVGLRPSAPLGLTETERRVADLAATGRTNREIADALFVSPKTVEANLARVYQKLGVRSKAQLAARVASRREAPGS